MVSGESLFLPLSSLLMEELMTFSEIEREGTHENYV